MSTKNDTNTKGRGVSMEELEAAANRSFDKWGKAYEMLAAGEEPEKEEDPESEIEPELD